ncbi:MAG TPA: DUF58 domain-containing protein [Opitutaceae bacterium]|nr:DUF58 domain-containing protein [Opitutaceae bacterium]
MPSPSSSTLSAAKFIDPQALMSIGSLELRARTVVEGFWNGLHRSPYHGFSVEFTEYRQYTSGDDPRYVDWRVFARSDRYFIKKFEDETNLRCHLLLDRSRSMEYGSRDYTKAHYAATLAATLAYFLHLQGDAVGVMTFDEQVREFLPARHRAGHLRQLMFALEKPAAGHATNLTAPLERVTALVRKRGMIVLISDFLAPLERLEKNLTGLTAGGHEVNVFQVLDPVELNLGLEQASLFEDLESERRLYIDPATARSAYMEKLRAHCGALRETCRHLGVAYHQLSTAQPLEIALFEFLQARMRRGRQFRPGRSGNGGRR